MQPHPTRFALLIKAARQGDAAALTEIAELYEPQLRTVARSQLGPALRPYLDSVDLVQSVHRSLMVGLRQNKYEFSSPENLINLAVTMVRRKVARQWRRMQRQLRLGDDPSQDLLQLLASLGRETSDPAETAEYRDQLRVFCNQLSEEERCWIGLRLQGFSIAEIARAQGKDPHWLRVRLSRLRQRIRDTGVISEWL